jgi:hypothetical protein
LDGNLQGEGQQGNSWMATGNDEATLQGQPTTRQPGNSWKATTSTTTQLFDGNEAIGRNSSTASRNEAIGRNSSTATRNEATGRNSSTATLNEAS